MFLHIRSDLPSPLKSPAPATTEFRSLTATTACSVERFPDFQIVLRPVLSFRQRMSDTPSPSKSPTPATLYACSSTLTTACSVERSPDFQIVLAPVLVLRHRMSDTDRKSTRLNSSH